MIHADLLVEMKKVEKEETEGKWWKKKKKRQILTEYSKYIFNLYYIKINK
jgi:hypothetical protein